MKMRIFALSVVFLLLSSTTICAMEEDSEEWKRTSLEAYIDILQRTIETLENYNANNSGDPDVDSLLDDAGSLLQDARDLIEDMRYSEAHGVVQSASELVREATDLLEIGEDDIADALESRLERMEKILIMTKAIRDRFHENGTDTPRIDDLLSLIHNSLVMASDHIDSGKYVQANHELNNAAEYYEEIQEIARIFSYKYHFWTRVSTFLENAPENIDGVGEYLDEMRDVHGLDTSQAETLLQDYAELIDEATMSLEEGDLEECIQSVRSSIDVGKQLAQEIRDLNSQIDGA